MIDAFQTIGAIAGFIAFAALALFSLRLWYLP